MIDGFTLYKINRAVKLHFTQQEYNVFIHKTNINGMTFESYLKSKSYNTFETVVHRFKDKHDAVEYLVANYAYGNFNPLFNNYDGELNRSTWIKRKQSLTKVFESDLDSIELVMDKMEINKSSILSGDMPILLNSFLSNIITVETVFLLNKEYNFLSKWVPLYSLLWGKELRIIEKLNGFIKYDEEKIKNKLKNSLQAIGSIV